MSVYAPKPWELKPGPRPSATTPSRRTNSPIFGSYLSPSPSSSNRSRSEVDQLKAGTSFVRLLEREGFQVKRTGNNHQCCCPFHADRTPSFTVYEDSRGHCYGCNWRGDVIKFIMDRRKLGFPKALAFLRELPYVVVAKSPVRPIDPPVLTSHSALSPAGLPDFSRHSERLRDDPWLFRRIAGQREWLPETIQQLARDGHLGWSGDALVFIYEAGAKFRRWPGREMIWEGALTAPWRSNRIEKAQKVFLTEGETDAISLVDSGIEQNESHAVVAVPGARIFKQEWTSLFTGKEVTVCYDADHAGEEGAERVIQLLKPVTSKLFRLDLKEVTR